MYHPKILAVILAVNFFSYSAFSEDGKTLFKNNCAACHSIGKGRLVGPDLKDVHTRYEESRLIKWIKNAPQMIQEGDSQAVALYNEYNKVMMTNFSFLSDEQVINILTYIKEESSVPSTVVASAPVSIPEQTNQAANKSSDISLSTADYILVSLVLLLLLIVIILSRTIKKLSDQLSDHYSSSSSF